VRGRIAGEGLVPPAKTCRIPVFRLRVKPLLVEPCPDRPWWMAPPRPPKNGLTSRMPRAADHHGESWIVVGHQRATSKRPVKTLASTDKISMLQHETASLASGRPLSGSVPGQNIRKKQLLKVIASSIRKGNVIEQDGKLYVVLTAREHPPRQGKRRSARSKMRRNQRRGLKVSERYKTTDQVEKATIEDQNFNYLYKDARRLPLHEQRQLRSSSGAGRRHRQRRALPAGKT